MTSSNSYFRSPYFLNAVLDALATVCSFILALVAIEDARFLPFAIVMAIYAASRTIARAIEDRTVIESKRGP